MAAIGKIREQSTLLLIIIGGAMVAFVLGDMFSNRGSSPADQYVGEVFGEEINYVDYEQRVEAQKQSMASIGQAVSSSQEQQIRNQVWNDMVQERILYTEMNKIGMRLGQDEFDDIRFGENVRDDFAGDESFKDAQSGQFDPQLVQNYFSFLKEQYPLFYTSQVNKIVNERLYEKYNTLVKRGIYANDIDGKDEFYRQEQKVKFDYVVKEYTSIADSLIEVSDKELLAFYNKHKDEGRFDREASVALEFVVFDVEPTAGDEEAIQEDLVSYISDFKNKNDDEDSLFVLKYSDSRNAAQKQLKGGADEELQAMIDGSSIGDVIGPYKTGTNYAIAKVKSIEAEEQATVRHILLSNQTQPDMEVLKTKADSIKGAIQNGADFAAMVTEFSEDPGSVERGGVYDWFNRTTMVAPFTEASFEKPIGSLNIVETTYGIHIVEPIERREASIVQVLELDSRIEPSNETFNAVYDEANEFSIAAGDIAGLESLSEERSYELKEGKEITSQARNLPGIAASADAVRWAHNAESTAGSVSQPFEFDRKIVVVGLVSKRASGLADFEVVKEEFTPEVIQEKKAEQFIAEMKDKSVDALKSELSLEVKNAANVNEQRPNLPGGANEPYIVGYALTLSAGDESSALKGNRGVYVIRLSEKDEIEPREEYVTYQDELNERKANALKTYTAGVYRALKDYASVKDERTNVY